MDKTVKPGEGNKVEGKEEFTQKQLVEGIRTLAQQVQAMGRVIQEQKGEIVELKTKGLNQAASKKDSVDLKDDKNDLELMNRQEFLDHIVQTVQKATIAPLSAKLDEKERQAAAAAAREKIETITKEDEDFWHFESEIRELARSHPSLAIDELYALAKVKSPEKVAGLEEAKAAKVAEEEKEKEKNKVPEFSGLLPTSGMSSPNTRMTPVDAAEKAWDDLGMSSAMAAANLE